MGWPQHEILVPTMRRDLHRTAERGRQVLAAARARPRERVVVARLGRLLVGAGGRLEAAARRPTAAPWVPVGDPCLECGR